MLGPPLCSCSPTLYREGTMSCLLELKGGFRVDLGLGTLLLTCRGMTYWGDL